MLINCPECELQVSDKAIFCPHCGFPLEKRTTTRLNSRKSHTQRLPNGFGQITKISSKNLRNPYRVMVTIGKNEYGKPICKLLKPQAYFPTYNDAYAALVNYNKQPYDITNTTTLGELYSMWLESKKYNGLKETTKKAYTSAWNHCKQISNIKVNELRIKHVRTCMESFDAVSTKKTVKSLLTVLLDYAIQYEIIERNCVREYKLEDDDPESKEHIAFTDNEISKLWKYQHIGCADWVLIQCYTGLRPTELLDMRLENINLKECYMTGGMKTKAGTDRVIPIHSKILPLVEKIYQTSRNRESEYLISTDDNLHLNYHAYLGKYQKLLALLKLNPEHRLHDPRKHFVTMAKEYSVNEYAIKRIVGHAIQDITERTYTERSIDWLKSEVEKIV